MKTPLLHNPKTFAVNYKNTLSSLKQNNLKKLKNISLLTPIFGTILFVLLYIIATFYYPGGSQVNKNSIGFSWINNYWCNLLNDNAINGQHNPAKPIAISAMFILCSTLTCFWWLLPAHVHLEKLAKLSIQISGTLAITIAFLMFTNINHDLVINLASIFGLIAIFLTFIALYKKKWYHLFAFGLFNLLLIAFNNYIYYNKQLIIYLPLIQKLSFATFLVWICCININLYQSSTTTKSAQKHPQTSPQ